MGLCRGATGEVPLRRRKTYLSELHSPLLQSGYAGADPRSDALRRTADDLAPPGDGYPAPDT
jgi:hypothetical protein